MDNFLHQTITLKNSRGNNIVGILDTIDQQIGRPVVIVASGMHGTKYTSAATFAYMLCNKGLDVLRFDFYAHGESEGNFPELTLSEAIHNIELFYKYLKVKGYTKFGLVGISFGGAASILFNSMVDDIRVLGLRSPVADYYTRIMDNLSQAQIDDWYAKGYKEHVRDDGSYILNISFVEDAKTHNGFQAATKITNPVLIVHGDQDKIVSIEYSHKLVEILPNAKLEVIVGADHEYTNPDDKERTVQLITDFVAKELLEIAATQS